MLISAVSSGNVGKCENKSINTIYFCSVFNALRYNYVQKIETFSQWLQYKKLRISRSYMTEEKFNFCVESLL